MPLLLQEEYKRKGVDLSPDVWLVSFSSLSLHSALCLWCLVRGQSRSPCALQVKLLVGAIDRSFDEQD